MGVASLNLSRLIVHRGITWFHVILFFLIYSSAYAQSNSIRPNDHDHHYGGVYSTFDPKIAIAIVVLISAFFFVGVFSIFIRQCSESEARISANLQQVGGNRAPQQGVGAGLDPDMIEKFPVFVYADVKNVKIGRVALECAICLSEFEDDEKLRVLPRCNHVFHPECIYEWLNFHITCPVCRANLTTTGGDNQKSSTPNAESNQQNYNPTGLLREIAINVDEEQNAEVATKNRPPIKGISGKFPRSHSTGHSLIQAGENMERFTLRLPEELRNQIMETAKLKRAMSFDVNLATEGSSGKDIEVALVVKVAIEESRWAGRTGGVS